MTKTSEPDSFPTRSLPFQSTSEDMGQYFRKIKSYPILEPDEEYELAQRWYQSQDADAAQRLITSHLRLVVRIAAGYRGYGLPMADLIAEGNIGILNAMKKFDPEKGFRFSTYAIWWIKAAIQDYIVRTWSLVKIGTTAAQRKLFFNLKRMKKEISELEDDFQGMTDKDIRVIAKELKVTETEVREMEERLSGGDASLNASPSSEGEGPEWQDWIESASPSQEEKSIETDKARKQTEILEKCLQYLTPREVVILKARRLEEPPKTLDAISKEVGVSKERIRQIEERAFAKLREIMRQEFSKRGWTDLDRG
ncbi:MAG: RNA polymerase factor sigma-32 [Alphaproteobacteria bacterium RIFCSPLOWO2_01_FULL_45_8]|nr:MAG: RNA polymerase factor sigma-32 [Alphaproteobacteria bacterium GWB1_45_5]OFW76669.1 MAG: RNA polymerase factor sigma-32 [Alphaproteobacteria bacterium GWA1_45_9]OFW89747.1 MAG: RNA polymerase factor sigma-32 [Alphaproteobacteria bacterium RIFCSPHIGHO2_01_FULL_41_14]OFW96221.1 MAG: RNA polymerase factor sigma-32 [Alphaproteobacteria bacterium RIFCSPLOWO2_01_FULL_45_8]HCI48417.1 RNA polymerase sigma factor RpoH [Holosporales bacterium]